LGTPTYQPASKFILSVLRILNSNRQQNTARWIFSIGFSVSLLVISTASNTAEDIKHYVLRLLAPLVLLLLFWPDPNKRHFTLPPRALCFWAGLAIALSALSTFWGAHASWEIWFDGVLSILLCLEALLLFQTRDEQRVLWWGWFMATIPICIYSWIQCAGLDPLQWQLSDLNPVGSTLGNRNFLAYFLLATIPVALYQYLHGNGWLRRFAALVATSSMLTLVLNESRMAWGALPLIFILAFVHMVKPALTRWVAGGIFGVILIGASIVYITTPMIRLVVLTHQRSEIWFCVRRMIADKPWWGFGAGSFPHTLPMYTTQYLSSAFGIDQPLYNAHNVLLHLLAAYGILGVTALLGFAFSAIIPAFRARNSANVELRFWTALALACCTLFALTGEVAEALYVTLCTWILLAMLRNSGSPSLWIIPYPRQSLKSGVIVFVLLLVAFAYPVYRAHWIWEKQVLLRQATHAHGSPQEVELAWTNLGAWDGTDPHYLHYQAMSALAAGDTSVALTRLQQITRKDPFYGNIHFEMGSIYYRRGQYVEAAPEFLQATLTRPTLTDNPYFLALTYVQLKDWYECIRWCVYVINNNQPRTADAKTVLIYAQKMQKLELGSHLN